MASLTKQSNKATPASMALMNAVTSKQAGRNLAASLLAMNATAARSTLRQLLASMLTFNLASGIALTNASAIPIDNNTNTLSWPVTVTPDPNNCLVVCAQASSGATVSSCTYAGVNVPMFQQVQQASNIQGHSVGVMQAWQGILLNPPTGTNTLTINWGSSPSFLMGGFQVFTGVDQINPTGPGSVLAFTGTAAPSLNVTAQRNGCWIVDAIVADSNTSGPTSPQVRDGRDTELFFFGELSHNPNVALGSVSDGYDGTFIDAAIVAVALNPANGNLTRQTKKYLSGSSALFSGSVSKTAAKSLGSVLNAFGISMARASAKGLVASCASFAASTARSAGRSLLSSMSAFSPSTSRTMAKGMAGSSAAFSASQSRATNKTLQASAPTFSASSSRSFAKTISAAMQKFTTSFVASVFAGTHYAVALGASMVSFVASVSKQSAKGVPAASSPFGAVMGKTSTKGLGAGLRFSGSTTKASARTLAAQTAGFSVSLGRGTRKGLAAAQAVFSASISGTLQQIQPALDSLLAIAVSAYGKLRAILVGSSASEVTALSASPVECELAMIASAATSGVAMLAAAVSVRCSIVAVALEVNHV